MADQNNYEFVLSAVDQSKEAFQSILGSLGQLENNTKSTQEAISHAFSEMTSAVSGFGTALLGLGAGAGIAGVFNELIFKTAQYGAELHKESQMVGMAVQDLGGLKFAAEMSGTSVETMSKGLGILDKNMEEAAAGTGRAKDYMDLLHMSVKNADGTLKTNIEIIKELADKFHNMEDGAGKTAIAMAFFGRSGKELIPLLNQGSEGIGELTKKAKELGIVLDEKSTEAAHRFEQNLTTLKEGVHGLAISIGNKLIPILNQLFDILNGKNVEHNIGEVQLKAVEKAMERAQGLINQKSSWYGFMIPQEDIEEAKAQLEELGKQRAEILKKYFTHDKPATVHGPKEKAPVLPDKHEKEAREVEAPAPGSSIPFYEQEFEEQENALARQAEAEGRYYETSKEKRRAYWQEILDMTKGLRDAEDGALSGEDRVEIERKVFALEAQIRKEAFNDQMMQLKMEADNTKASYEVRVAAAMQMVQKIGATYNYMGPHYQAAIKDVEKIEQEHQNEMTKLEEIRLARVKQYETSELAITKEKLDTEVALGRMSKAEEENILQQYEERAYQKKLQALYDEIMLDNLSLTAKEQTLNKILALEQEHELRRLQIIDKGVIAEQNEWKRALQPITQAFENALQGMISGTESFAQAMRSLGNSLANDFIRNILHMTEKWIIGELTKTAATDAGNAARLASDEAAQVAGSSAHAAMSLKQIINDAAKAAAGAYSAVVEIPIIGPILAPPAAAVAFAAVSAFEGLVGSFEIGAWNVPYAMPAIVHQGETILPKPFAEDFRAAVSSRESGSGDGGQVTHVFKGIKKDELYSGADLLNMLSKLHRDGHLKARFAQ